MTVGVPPRLAWTVIAVLLFVGCGSPSSPVNNPDHREMELLSTIAALETTVSQTTPAAVSELPVALPTEVVSAVQRWSIEPIRMHVPTEYIWSNSLGESVADAQAQGWTYIVLELGIKNISGEWAAPSEARPLLSLLKLQTAEGYLYEVLNKGGIAVADEPDLDVYEFKAVHLPPDFSCWWSVGFKVAKSATGYRLVVPDGTMRDLGAIAESELFIAGVHANLPLYEQNSLEFPNKAILRFGPIQGAESIIRLQNLVTGYQTTLTETFYVIDSRGLIMNQWPDLRVGRLEIPSLTVGPGQVTDLAVRWPEFSRPAYLVAEGEVQAVFLIP